jgi:hypothetical protein
VLDATRKGLLACLPVRLRWLLVVATIALALMVRTVLINGADLGPDDLARYEQRAYGVDLPDWYGRKPFFLYWSLGDGQAFVTMATDLGLDGPVQGLADPVYRYSRVGYSWLGRVFALGQAHLVPVGLFVVNVAALGGLAFWLGKKRKELGWRVVLGLASPALYVAFASDTSELVGVALTSFALFADRGGTWAAAALGVVRPELAPVLLASNRPWLRAAAAGSVAAVARLVGGLAMDWKGSVFGGGSIGWPIAGYLEAWRHSTVLTALGSAAFLVATVLTLYVGATRRTGVARLAWLAIGGLSLLLAPQVVQLPGNYLRTAAPLVLLWTIPSSPKDHSTG